MGGFRGQGPRPPEQRISDSTVDYNVLPTLLMSNRNVERHRELVKSAYDEPVGPTSASENMKYKTSAMATKLQVQNLCHDKKVESHAIASRYSNRYGNKRGPKTKSSASSWLA